MPPVNVHRIQIQIGREAGLIQLKKQPGKQVEISNNAPGEALIVLMNKDNPSNLADFLPAMLNLGVEQKSEGTGRRRGRRGSSHGAPWHCPGSSGP